MRLDTLQDLLVEQLHQIYSSEQQVTETLPTMAQDASSSDLKALFQKHLQTTSSQLKRLDDVFQKLGINHDHQKCEGMEGLIKESSIMLEKEGDPAIKDTALIAAAQKIENYETSVLSDVRTYARELGYDDIADLLQKTLDEQTENDKQLSSLAKGGFFR